MPEATDSYTGFLAERLAVRVDIIDAAFWPTAAEWYRHFSGEGLAEDDAVAAALEVVDAHAATLRSALRLRP